MYKRIEQIDENTDIFDYSFTNNDIIIEEDIE
jgi:hypothetical protein